jgi:hypothetical protein
LIECKCPIPETHDKFTESHYFINGMMNNYHAPDVFRWNLNGFLQASRSVIDYAYEELKRKNGFRQWWPSQDKIIMTDAILEKFRKGRNFVVHERSLKVRSTALVGIYRFKKLKFTTDINAPAEMYSQEILESAKQHIIGSILDKEHSEVGMEIGVERRWYAEELGDDEIIRCCDSVFSKLSKIVLNAHKFCNFKSNVAPEHLHDISKVRLLTEADIDPSLPTKWGWK